ncbi:MAG: CDP-glycerol glycerophosphotransferase family protein [candidate division Zixibacteria bacterium]|nr:CDP-glycerol glycerophosphotransferase family protein [candidate division Zixibacteria bacterium]
MKRPDLTIRPPQVHNRQGGVIGTARYILLLPIYFLARIIPKNNRLAVFGSRHGTQFADNSKYLFLYVSRNVKNVTAVFISRNREVVHHLKENGYNACYTLSWKGIWIAVRARKCFISNSTHDIHSLLIGGAEIIQLWHGTPLKMIGYDMNLLRTGSLLRRLKYGVRGILFWLFPYLNTTMSFDKLVIASQSVSSSFRSAFRLPDEDIFPLGQARNDSLCNGFEFDRNLFPEIQWLEDIASEVDTIISWLPTHRRMSGRSTYELLDSYSFDADQLEAALEKHNALLIVKIHFLDKKGLRGRFDRCKHIIVSPFDDPYPLLRYTDLLITDYSSIYFDYLLLNRPIIFTPFDLEEYIRDDARLYYDYNDVTPGNKCYNWNDVLDALDRNLNLRISEEIDPYAEHRREVCKRFNDYTADNSKRIIDHLF